MRVGDLWVVLDVARGDYVTLHDPGEEVFLGPDRCFTTSDKELGVALTQAGLTGRRVGTATVAGPPPTQATAGATPAGRPRAGDVLRFILALLLTAGDLRRPFAELVRPQGRLNRLQADAVARRHAAMFHELLVWSPWQGECLFRSRCLLRYLRLQGCSADWAFGVRGWPFRAHCWVSVGAALLNETAEGLRAYSVVAVF